MGNKGFDQFPASLTEFLGATEFSGKALDHGGIELMLANQKAQPIAQSGLAVAGTVPI
jgi:hypothetical protein